jgi:hypothetical protein
MSACASHPSSSQVAFPRDVAGMTAKAGHPTGKVIIDVSGLLGTLTSGSRQTLAFGVDPAKFPITHMRLSVFYPGVPIDPESSSSSPQPVVLTETPVGWNTAGLAADGKPTVPSGFITATAHAGPNRVFTVEALSGTRTLMRMKAAATITANGTATIKLNFLEDAIGRTIEALIDEERWSYGEGGFPFPNEGDLPFPEDGDLPFPGGGLPFMYVDDLVEPLRAYLTNLTGFDPHTNTYRQDRPAPQYLRVNLLAEKLFQDKGIGWLSAPTGTLADDMKVPFNLNEVPEDAKDYVLLSMLLKNDENIDLAKVAQYRITIIAPTDKGWMPTEHTSQPFEELDIYNFGDPTWVFKTHNLPPGRHLLALNRPDGTILYRVLEVDIDGMRPGELLQPDA